MALIFKLAPFLGKSHIKELQENNLIKGQRILSSWLIFAIGIRFILNLFSSGYQFYLGHDFQAESIVVFNLNFLVLFWILMPMIQGLKDTPGEILTLRFMLSPVKNIDYLIIQCWNFISTPSTLILTGISILTMLPLLLFKFSWVLIVSCVFYLFCLICFSLLLNFLPQSILGGSSYKNISRVLLAVLAILLLLINPQFQWTDNELYVWLLNHKTLFRTIEENSIFTLWQGVNPGAWLLQLSQNFSLGSFLKLSTLGVLLLTAVYFTGTHYKYFHLKYLKRNRLKKNTAIHNGHSLDGNTLPLKNQYLTFMNYAGNKSGLFLGLAFMVYSVWQQNHNLITFYLTAGLSLSLWGSFFFNRFGSIYRLLPRIRMIPQWAQKEFKEAIKILLLLHMPLAMVLGLFSFFLLPFHQAMNYLLFNLALSLLIFSIGNITSILLFFPHEEHKNTGQEKGGLLQGALVILSYGFYLWESSSNESSYLNATVFILLSLVLFLFMFKKAPDYIGQNLMTLQQEAELLP